VTPSDLVGLRRGRSGPLLLATAAGLTLQAGERVLVSSASPDEGPFLATVIVGSGQLIASEVALVPSGAVIGRANEPAQPQSSTSLPGDYEEWLRPPGADSEPGLLPGNQSDELASEFIKRLFGPMV